jgi:hypothetical protein
MRDRFRLPVGVLLALCLVAIGTAANAATVAKRNIGDLIALGDIIVTGKVVSVTDGFDANNVPYTQVTVNVSEAMRGETGGTYTFRQYGLTKPRDMGDGRVNLNVTPDGWPTYSVGEDVVLFLYKEAAWTGLRTTVGLFQGKFTVRDGALTNIIDNEGLFDNLRVDKTKLSEKELEMVSMDRGKVSADVFTSFVRKAVHEKWFPQIQEKEE